VKDANNLDKSVNTVKPVGFGVFSKINNEKIKINIISLDCFVTLAENNCIQKKFNITYKGSCHDEHAAIYWYISL
jgi:hypothetical protein